MEVQRRSVTSLNHYFFEPLTLSTNLGLGNACIELEHAVVPVVDYLIDQVGWNSIISHEEVLTNYLLGYLTAYPDLYTVYDSRTADAKARVSLISFTVNGIASDKVAARIHETSRCWLISGDCWSPRTTLNVLGLAGDEVFRVSLVHYNTVSELQEFIIVLDEVVRAMER